LHFLNMPSSSLSDQECSPHSLIPPTPESNHSNSPQTSVSNSPQSPFKVYESSPHRPDDSSPEIPQKRKAGRKPLYKTAQERRDRNRRAQLAFRARRSDYLGRLEDTCRSLENVVMELQESNRATNDALARERNRVKNLERIIQGIANFQAQQPVQPIFSNDLISDPVEPIAGQQGVSFLPFQPDLSLITLEQQYSSSSVTSAMYNLLFPDNFLGMLPIPLLTLVS
jgi:hypothetical protein